MVEITEASSERHESSSRGTHVTFIDFLKNQPTDIALFLTRLITIFCSLYYALPIGTRTAQQTAYSRAFFAAAATNALRLHQRVGALKFSREFFLRVIAEDACHYLFYSLLFVNTIPVTMALLPIFLFAVLHAANFLTKVCDGTGNGDIFIARKLKHFSVTQTSNSLRLIACSEIFIMPLLIAMIFTGTGSIFYPFIYYRFLVFRYMSRRNDTTRTVFSQLRCSLENAVDSPNCPQLFRNAAHAFIRFLCLLCPAQV